MREYAVLDRRESIARLFDEDVRLLRLGQMGPHGKQLTGTRNKPPRSVLSPRQRVELMEFDLETERREEMVRLRNKVLRLRAKARGL